MWFDGKNKEQEKKQKTAVAVAYEPGDAAPKILAAGKGEVAERIIEKAKENERNIASIDPESYIAKEIKYQTALLHAISEEVYQIKKAIEKNEGLCSSLRKKFVIFKSKR